MELAYSTGGVQENRTGRKEKRKGSRREEKKLNAEDSSDWIADEVYDSHAVFFSQALRKIQEKDFLL